MNAIIALDPANYERSCLHAKDRIWAETNCYVDVLIELIHSLGFDPRAGLAFSLAVDFEVDQWTFFKYPHEDLYTLYGMDVIELNPWVSLLQHVEEQVGAGRPVLVEMDSFYLPDTLGTAYQSVHTKTTIAVNTIDAKAGSMGYFHGQAYYELSGPEFRDIFQVDGLVHERMLPPYIEVVKLTKNSTDVQDDELTTQSIASLRTQLERLPAHNPFDLFRARFEKDLEWLASEPMETFHGYSFATLRQYGACFELAANYLDWLAARGETGLDTTARTYAEISEIAKTVQFKLARTLARKRTLDLGPIDEMSTRWQAATQELVDRYL